jgi:CRP-like cAMP-binding protein
MNLSNLFRNEPAIKVVADGEAVFREGEAADAMYVVLEGDVDVVHGGQVIETIGPGGIVGEMALIEQAPRSATAVARGPVRLAAVSQQRFNFLVQQTPGFALHVMRVLVDRLRRTTRRA